MRLWRGRRPMFGASFWSMKTVNAEGNGITPNAHRYSCRHALFRPESRGPDLLAAVHDGEFCPFPERRRAVGAGLRTSGQQPERFGHHDHVVDRRSGDDADAAIPDAPDPPPLDLHNRHCAFDGGRPDAGQSHRGRAGGRHLPAQCRGVCDECHPRTLYSRSHSQVGLCAGRTDAACFQHGRVDNRADAWSLALHS